MMGGIDEDAEWLALLVFGLVVLIIVVGVVVVGDLWHRARRIAGQSPGPADVALLATAVVSGAVATALRHWWAGLVTASIIVLAWRTTEAAAAAMSGADTRPGPIVILRRLTLLIITVGTTLAI